MARSRATHMEATAEAAAIENQSVHSELPHPPYSSAKTPLYACSWFVLTYKAHLPLHVISDSVLFLGFLKV